MAKKKSTPKGPAVELEQGKDQTVDDALANGVLRPSVQASLTLNEYGKIWGDLSLNSLADVLGDQIKSTQKGDLGRGEAMLTAQAHTLDAIFNNLARRAVNTDYINQMEAYLKLALKAQSQCRTTWEAISAMKNPPMIGYARQANIAHGPQQVNNGTAPARENEMAQNKLLEDNDGERLDTGAAGTAGRTDPDLAPLGAVDRTENA